LRRDVHADAELPVDHLLHARGVPLVAPAGAVVGGLTAVELWGAPGFAAAEDPVELLLPPGIRWTPGPGFSSSGRDLLRRPPSSGSSTRRASSPDRRRLNRLSAAGWRVPFVTAADLHRPEELVLRIAAALGC
jgi:hypothetical protein